jgi:excisionase family DNA binding protein
MTELLTVDQSRGRLRVGWGRVYRLVVNGELAHITVGASIRVIEANLDDFLEANSHPRTAVDRPTRTRCP